MYEDEFNPTTYYVNEQEMVPEEPDKIPARGMVVTLLIIAANLIAYYFSTKSGSDYFRLGGLNYEYVMQNKEYSRLISYMFLHNDIGHLANNMIGLALYGLMVEPKLGSLRTTIIYFGSGILGGLSSMLFSHMLHPLTIRFSVGASAAVFGMICASMFVSYRRSEKTKKKDIIKAIVITVLLAVFSYSENVDLWGHVFGALFGGVLSFVFTIRRWDYKRENLYKRLLGILLTLILCIVGAREAAVQKAGSPIPDTRVNIVKEQLIYPEYDVTYGEGLDKICANGTWISFTAADEDVKVIQYTGVWLKDHEPKDVLIQFVLVDDEKTFTMYYFSVDGEYQNHQAFEEFIRQAITN